MHSRNFKRTFFFLNQDSMKSKTLKIYLFKVSVYFTDNITDVFAVTTDIQTARFNNKVTIYVSFFSIIN